MTRRYANPHELLYPPVLRAPVSKAPEIPLPPRVRTPQAVEALYDFIVRGFGVSLPRTAYTRGHSHPFGFIADAWFNPGRDVAAWANRSGGKTLSASILVALEFLSAPMLEGRVVAGTEDQAGCLYDYWVKWCRPSGVLGGRVAEVRKYRTALAGGGRFEIVPATQAGVRGPKVQLLVEDEVDEIDPAIDAAAVGMLASRGDLKARTVYASTWHNPNGLMGALVTAAPTNAVRLHKWNVWESLANCPRDVHLDGAGCQDCPLGRACVPKARELSGDPEIRASQPSSTAPKASSIRVGIAAQCSGLLSPFDVGKAYMKLDPLTWEAEYECRRPQITGLVYPTFDPARHRVSEAPTRNVTYYRAVDWGYTHFVCLWLGVCERTGLVYLLDTYEGERCALGVHVAAIKARRYPVAATYCDPAGRAHNDQTGRSNIQYFERHGIPCRTCGLPGWKIVSNGVRLVRSYLESASGATMFRYVGAPGNQRFEEAMMTYRNRRVNGVYVDDPEDPQPDEHIPDALRYFFVNRFGSTAFAYKGVSVC